MTDLLEYAIRGFPVGCVFALMAIGIVLTYKTSGVLNLAFGAQAYVSAAVFYVLVDGRGLSVPLAFVVAVLICGPALGWILDRALYRHLRTARPLTKLVTSLGLLVAIPQIVKLDFLLGPGQKLRPPGIANEELVTFGEFAVTWNEIATIVCTALVVLGLSVLFRYTNLGLQMRAVVESPRMTELAGVNADRIGAFSWMLSSTLAALAGVLIAPLFAAVNDLNFFALLISALAAAAFARLVSIPLALVGGLLLGIGQNILAGVLPSGAENQLVRQLSVGLRPSLPFVVLFLLLLFWPGLRNRREAMDPLAGVDPPPPAPVAAERSRGLTIGTRAFAVVVIVGGSLITLFVLSASWLDTITKGVILSVIFLSFTVITGMGGQISLCQAAFAAIGACATGQLVENAGMTVLPAMVIGAIIAAVVGAIVALPALRLSGIYLALATLAFALMFEAVVRPLDWVGGGSRPPKVPRPLLLGIDFGNDKAFFLLCAALLALVGGIVILIRGGTTGRYLDALRGSETAATSIGISPARAKVTAFAISAAIAGFGGGLLASLEGRVNLDTNFSYYLGLVWVVLVVTLGARSVQAAINAGISFVLFPEILEFVLERLPFVENPQTLGLSIAYILFGFGAITYAKHPEGIVEAQSRKSVQRMMRRRQAKGGSSTSVGSTGGGAAVAAAVPGPTMSGVATMTATDPKAAR